MKLRIVAGPALALAFAAPSVASADCITRLPVKVSFPKGDFAISYPKSIPVRVTSTGPRIRNMRVAMYTFKGTKLGEVAAKKTMVHQKTLTMKLRYGAAQSGKYTLMVTGEPNANRSCGPKEYHRVVTLKDCITRLPITFPKPPGGSAADYEGYVSQPIMSKNGTLLKDLVATLYDDTTNTRGTGKLKALFGKATLDVKLSSKLTPGRYRLVIEGTAPQPASCGAKTVAQTLTFR